VRQYDQPYVSVVIPVGPGHEEQVINALDSLEAQTFRQWEAILAWDSKPEKGEWIKTAYPFVRWADGGQKGAGAARNRGVEIARAPLLFFLDADDWLYPSALADLLQVYAEELGRQERVAVYSDCVGLAYIDNPEQLTPDAQKRIIERRDDGWTVIYQPMLDFDCDRVMGQPDLRAPYVWNLISTLFPREWHDEIGGFDEAMPSWEDWDYWLRMAWAGKCFVRVPKDLLVYQFYSGQRREIGLQNAKNLVQYMQDKLRRLPAMANGGCSHCGQPRAANMPPTRPSQHTQEVLAVNDDAFVMARYLSANKGEHGVVGVAQFPNRIPGIKMIPRNVQGQTVFIIDYGYRSGGDRFLVHRRDLRLSPTQFAADQEETAKVVLPHAAPPVQAAPVAPQPLRELLGQQIENVPAPVITVQAAPQARQEEIDPIELALQQAQTFERAQPEQKKALPAQDPQPVMAPSQPTGPDLQTIPGVSSAIAEQMEQLGLRTPQDVASFVRANGIPALMQINGVGERKAESIAAAVLAPGQFGPVKVEGIPPELAGIIQLEEK
jgi:glycosyltransferase involved in cell wall biosynthesis/predicted flap endonuclease-1-like 5' DNA nuclease